MVKGLDHGPSHSLVALGFQFRTFLSVIKHLTHWATTTHLLEKLCQCCMLQNEFILDQFNSPSALFNCTDFNVFHMIAVGLSSSILGCLVTLLVYTYCQRYQQQSHDATVIHPISAAPLNTSITNHINKLDKYDTVEAIKVSTALCCSEINARRKWSKCLSLVPWNYLIPWNILNI